MHYTARVPLGWALALLAVAGCGAVEQARNAAKRDTTMNALKQVGLAFHNFHDRNGSAAKSWDDLIASGLPAEQRQLLEQEGYVLVLGVAMRDATIGTSNFVLAYPQNATGSQVPVLKMDGSVQSMSPQELTQALADQQANMANAVVVNPGAASGGGSPPTP